MQVAVAGAGFSGAVIARRLAERGHHVDVFETRDHVAGNCHTARDPHGTGVMMHVYGPHIFHTDNERVWRFVHEFGLWEPYIQRTKAHTPSGVYSWPINLHTINQFFSRDFSPREARAVVVPSPPITDVRNFYDKAVSMVGRDLYWEFLASYTRKQWGRDPKDLPADILTRLPIRFDYNDNAFHHKYQAIPRHGYTQVVEAILDHRRIDVRLRCQMLPTAAGHDYVFWSGPVDAFFGHREGRLPYRSLRFETIRAEGDYQGCAVMNYCDAGVSFTRVTEHKHFTPWETHSGTVVYREHSLECSPGDEPFYPVRLAGDQPMWDAYRTLAQAEKRVRFVGRLGTFRYLDMDVTIAEALDAADNFLENHP